MSLDAACLPTIVISLARAVEQQGGRVFVVGGWVRDALRGGASKDLDLEVFGLDPERLEALVLNHGFTGRVGRQFPVWRHTERGVDVALARGGADAVPEAAEAFENAARARDLTVNAIGFDPLSGGVLDPLGGQADLVEGHLRAADLDTFGDDPLRVLRVARLAAQLNATPDEALVARCASLDLGSVPPERVAQELERILVELRTPWTALESLDRLGQLGVLEPVAALRGVPQDPEWHPEGDVFVHTGRVVDCAAALALEEGLEGEPRSTLLWAALCHDLGKAEATVVGEDGRVRSAGHDRRGAEITERWLQSLRLGRRRVEAVVALVRHHLAPALFVRDGAKPKAYRRLARTLAESALTPVDLERVARVDHLGRTTPEALAGRFDAGERFLERARAASVELGPREDVVRAATLMQRGIPAGPELGRLLSRARAIQDETGLDDEEALIERLFDAAGSR